MRFNFVKRLMNLTPKDELLEIAARVTALGWHIVIYFEAVNLPDVNQLVDEPEFEGFMRLMHDRARVHTKRSCLERLSVRGPRALPRDYTADTVVVTYPDVISFARRASLKPSPTVCSGALTGCTRTCWTTCPTTACWWTLSPTSRQPPDCRNGCSWTTRCGCTGRMMFDLREMKLKEF